jgi:CheY-like chemotaxis protein
MPKNILIIEADSSLSQRMRAALEQKGFGVEESSDGKGALDSVRRSRPDLVVLAVELPAGQNGYILCGKLKKDDDLKSTPVVIIGSPDGFAQHKKLKTRADEYVAKPVDIGNFVNAIGGVIGFPEVSAEVVEESISLSELVDEGSTSTQLAVEAPEEATVAGDPDLEMIDAVFEEDAPAPGPDSSLDTTQEISAVDSLGANDSPPVGDDAISALDALGDDGDNKTQMHLVSDDEPLAPPVAHAPEPAARTKTPPPVPRSAPMATGADAAELRNLRSRVAELEAAVQDAQHRASEHENRVHELEHELTAKTSELEASRTSSAAGSKSDKDFFALREANNRKDKEILKLKTELNEKEHELVELRDREMNLEQQYSESSGEIAKRDAQIKTLTARADQLAAERKKSDQQLLSAKEEARSASAKLMTLQNELDQAHSQMSSQTSELEALRSRSDQLETEHRRAQDELAEAKAELESLRGSSDSLRSELDGARSDRDQLQIELDAAKNQLSTMASTHEEEAGNLRKRVGELEDATNKHEERLTKLYGRIKGEEKVRDRTKKALAVALQLLEEHQNMVDLDGDESQAA